MKSLSVICRVLGHIWMMLFALVFVASIIGIFIAEPTFYHGWKRMTSTLSPFNIANSLVTIVLLLPGIGLYKASEYFQERADQTPNKPDAGDGV
jgi:hypothetical protein